jgi:hypothetical protein
LNCVRLKMHAMESLVEYVETYRFVLKHYILGRIKRMHREASDKTGNNMKMRKQKLCGMILAFGLFLLCSSCWGGFGNKQVAESVVTIPALPEINVKNADKFLNDLKLSPYWKVEKNRAGNYVAIARFIGPEHSFGEDSGEFLFEFMAKYKPRLPEGQIIGNKYLSGNNKFFSSFSIEVVFRKPIDSEVCFGSRGSNITLRIFELCEKAIGFNSYSLLAIKLSEKNDIYLVLREQGNDKSRKTTIQKLTIAMRELKHITELPDKYLVAETYKPFMTMLFHQPFGEHALGRFPGIQDRDTFYGYFKTKPNTSYEGINIKISHPVYCPDEGTRKFSRLEKAEYAGKPYFMGDVIFFLIEDNAVYLSEKYNKQFGIFSGKGSFDGNLEILNGNGVVLLKTTGKFKGWER